MTAISAPACTPQSHLLDVKIDHILSADLVSSCRNIVRSIFNEPDEAAILSMPLFFSTQADCRIWHYSSDGSYTVKSAYSLCMKQIIESSHEPVSSNRQVVWKFGVPQSVLSLLWCLLRTCLRTRVNLLSGGVQCQDI